MKPVRILMPAVLALFPGSSARAQASPFADCRPMPSDTTLRAALTSGFIPMPDGTRIAADVFLPTGLAPGKKLPAVLTATRYWRAAEGSAPVRRRTTGSAVATPWSSWTCAGPARRSASGSTPGRAARCATSVTWSAGSRPSPGRTARSAPSARRTPPTPRRWPRPPAAVRSRRSFPDSWTSMPGPT